MTSFCAVAVFLLIVLLSFKNVSPWSWPTSYNPYCYFKECCNSDWIINDLEGLKRDMRDRVYGQHLVETAIDAVGAHLAFPSRKALALSFHGWAGSGKNYVANFIASRLYKEGIRSKYVHQFIGRVHFPEESSAKRYQMQLYSWLKGNISQCPQQLFVFDEIDKTPADVLNAIKPMIDYRSNVDGQDYTRAIFIFLSNTGAGLINSHYEELYLNGKKREELTLKDFEWLLTKGAFNEEGGFHHSDVIKSSLIDHYIPFLPMHEHHVEMCIRDEFKKRGIFLPKESHVKEVLEFVEFGPDTSHLFAKTGCKRMDTKVGVLVQKHYPTVRRTEL